MEGSKDKRKLLSHWDSMAELANALFCCWLTTVQTLARDKYLILSSIFVLQSLMVINLGTLIG
jgi:hypothetical protein